LCIIQALACLVFNDLKRLFKSSTRSLSSFVDGNYRGSKLKMCLIFLEEN
jgi:hypothetical protein